MTQRTIHDDFPGAKLVDEEGPLTEATFKQITARVSVELTPLIPERPESLRIDQDHLRWEAEQRDEAAARRELEQADTLPPPDLIEDEDGAPLPPEQQPKRPKRFVFNQG